MAVLRPPARDVVKNRGRRMSWGRVAGLRFVRHGKPWPMIGVACLVFAEELQHFHGSGADDRPAQLNQPAHITCTDLTAAHALNLSETRI